MHLDSDLSRLTARPLRILLACLTAVVLVLSLGPSAAAWEGASRRHGLLWDSGNRDSFWGNFGFSDTPTLVFCADNSLRGVGTGSPYGNRTPVTSWVSDTGQRVPAADLPKVAYLLQKNGQTKDDRVAASTAVAIWTLLRSNGLDITDPGNRASQRAAGIDSAFRAETLDLLAEAEALAGPYTAAVSVPASGTVGERFTARFSLRSAAGKGVPGKPVTLALPGSAPVSGTTDAKGVFTATFAVPSVGATARVSGSAGGLADTMDVILPSRKDAQRALVVGQPTTVSASDELTIKVTPSVSTRTSSVVLRPGDSVSDIVMVRGGLPGASFSGTSTLFGPLDAEPELTDAAPADTPVVGTAEFSGTFDDDGAATVRTTPLTVDSAGYYVWQETLEAGRHWGRVTGRFGEARETSVALEPTLETTVSTQQAMVGDTISDSVTVSGIRTSVGGRTLVNTVTGVLAGPLPPVDGSCEGLDWSAAPTRKIEAFTVEESGTVSDVDTHTVAAAGCYSYGETLTVSLDDTVVAVVEHPVGEVPQTTLVQRFSPTTTTQTSSRVARPGGELSDRVRIEGCRPGVAVTGRADLFGPFATQPELGSSPDPELLIGSARFEDTCGGDGTVATTTDVLTLPEDAGSGYYVWHERLDETPYWPQVVAPFGAASETSLIMTPTVATQVSATEVVVGQTISDTVIVEGIVTEVGGTPIRHVISGTLHGPLPPVDGSCHGLDWTGAPTRTIEDLVVTENGTITGVDEHTVEEAGCFTYSEVLSSWLGEEEEPFSVVVHEPGHESQTVLVTSPPPPAAEPEPEPRPEPEPEQETPMIHAGVVGDSGMLWTAVGGLLILSAGAGLRSWQLRRDTRSERTPAVRIDVPQESSSTEFGQWVPSFPQ